MESHGLEYLRSSYHLVAIKFGVANLGDEGESLQVPENRSKNLVFIL